MNWKKLLLIAIVAAGFGFASVPASKAGVSIGIGLPFFGVGYYPGYYGYYPRPAYYPYGYGYAPYGYYSGVRVGYRPYYWHHGRRVYYARRAHNWR